MVSNTWSGLEVPCPLRKCATGEMCPHAVPMALATDRTGARKGNEGAITSRDVIATQNAASEALRGLGQ